MSNFTPDQIPQVFASSEFFPVICKFVGNIAQIDQWDRPTGMGPITRHQIVFRFGYFGFSVGYSIVMDEDGRCEMAKIVWTGDDVNQWSIVNGMNDCWMSSSYMDAVFSAMMGI